MADKADGEGMIRAQALDGRELGDGEGAALVEIVRQLFQLGGEVVQCLLRLGDAHEEGLIEMVESQPAGVL